MKLKLSEAILMGDSLKNPISCAFLLFEGNTAWGCALGGALLADGATKEDRNKSSGARLVYQHWPWLTYEQVGHISEMYSDLNHSKTVTIEQIADYVRTIEPQEEAGTMEDTTEEPTVEELWDDGKTMLELTRSIGTEFLNK